MNGILSHLISGRNCHLEHNCIISSSFCVRISCYAIFVNVFMGRGAWGARGMGRGAKRIGKATE
ncbi:Uncharacterized protein dnm_081210 [Desulfonema magnum]|uniref:Uncharacterized protein n=1 Tax=Desulfonema magnum TaxID=45655 RepID=A0A975BVD0_9BACT|nr:Uncharacterized protein dnm_081210 [Desulfonema magnum]